MDKFESVSKFIKEKAQLCWHQPQGQLSYPYVTPTYGVVPGSDDNSGIPERSATGHYLQMYDWDACFFSQGASRAGLEGVAGAVVGNFLQLQGEDGYIPRTVSPGRIWDGDDHCKPFLAQTFKLDADAAQMSGEYLPKLAKYLRYFQKHRMQAHNLCAWRNVLESGVDDNLALLAPQEAARGENESPGQFPDGMLLACDLNAYLIVECQAYCDLVDLYGQPAEKKEFTVWIEQMKEAMESRLWNEQLGLYCNLHAAAGEQIAIRSWTGLLPALLGICHAERIEQVIERNILQDEHFLRPFGLASMAASEPLYNQAKRGLYGQVIVSNWQGPMWTLPNTLAARCLKKYGYENQARNLAQRVLAAVSQGLKEYGTLFENYHAETGQPLWAPNFMSWNILCLELAELAG
jgi:hypothetical protein